MYPNDAIGAYSGVFPIKFSKSPSMYHMFAFPENAASVLPTEVKLLIEVVIEIIVEIVGMWPR